MHVKEFDDTANGNINEELNDNDVDANIQPANDQQQAAGSQPEDTVNAKDELIKQQQSTIDALLERTNSLTEQVNKLIMAGAAINDGKQQVSSESDDGALPDDYIALSELGREFGTR